MESLLARWDGERVVIQHDHPTGAWMIIAMHSTRLGPACGGTRMKTYPDLEAAVQDALHLAESMSYKFASIGFPCGGGKAVIAVPANFDVQARPDLLRRYGTLIHQLGGLFQCGADVGTSPADMDIISETGAPYVFSRTPQAGGAGNSGPPTALGVFNSMQVACEQLFGSESLEGKRILIQGVGSVGGRLIELLQPAGAEILFSEVDPKLIEEWRDKRGIPFVPAEQVYDTACDVFSPCALGGILNRDTTARRAVVGSANNQLAEPEDAERLQARQILYAPDFVTSFGGAMAIYGQEALHWSKTEAEGRVANSIKEALRQVFALAQAEQITPDAAARRIAGKRLFG
jgi:leucine dehydrogenase